MWRFAALHLFARVIALGAARLGGFDRLAVDDDDGGRRVFSCRLKEARMTIEENKAAVRRHLEDAWNRNKVTELEEYVSPDHVHYSGKKVETLGPNEIRALISNCLGGIPDFQWHIEDLIGEDDRVVARVRFTGTHTGTFQVASRTLPPSNKRVDEAEIIITRVADGKIVESWSTWDRLSMLGQLGAIPIARV
jgi:predicted ester cyclase